MSKPHVQQKPARNTVGSQKNYPRLSNRDRVEKEVRNLATYSPAFRDQKPQRNRVRDSHKGPEVWDIQWHTCYRKTHDGKLVSETCTLMVATNVRTGEVKYFVNNRTPGLMVGLFVTCYKSRLDAGKWKLAFAKHKRNLVRITSSVAVGSVCIAT